MNDSNTGKLAGYLESVTEQQRKDYLADVAETVTASKNAGKKLGAHLKAMRDALKKAQKWMEVVRETATLTGYSEKTILRWSESVHEPKKTTFDLVKERSAMASRLEGQKCLDKEVVAYFARRAMKAVEINEGIPGNPDAIKFMQDVVKATFLGRNMTVTVEIKAVTNG